MADLARNFQIAGLALSLFVPPPFPPVQVEHIAVSLGGSAGMSCHRSGDWSCPVPPPEILPGPRDPPGTPRTPAFFVGAFVAVVYLAGEWMQTHVVKMENGSAATLENKSSSKDVPCRIVSGRAVMTFSLSLVSVRCSPASFRVIRVLCAIRFAPSVLGRFDGSRVIRTRTFCYSGFCWRSRCYVSPL